VLNSTPSRNAIRSRPSVNTPAATGVQCWVAFAGSGDKPVVVSPSPSADTVTALVSVANLVKLLWL
jgi:hypothetical protein